MTLVLNEEQQMLKSSAKELLNEKASVATLRELRDSRNENGFDLDLWSEMGQLGWTSLLIPESYGGLDFGYVGMGQILEETGRTLTASPLFSTGVLATSLLNMTGLDEQKANYFTKIIDAQIIMAFAHEEGRHHSVLPTSCTLKNGVLNGEKTFVIDGHRADTLMVTTKSDNGLKICLVDNIQEGVSVERVVMLDSRNSAKVRFDNVQVAEENQLSISEIELDKLLDIARICVSAEMLGNMQETFERTIAYLKERKQFGVAIGSFQALQHRAAVMFCEIELCKSVVLKALKGIDEKAEDISELASMAKAKCGETLKLVVNEGVQMYGGIGMTDDEEIGFFMKRAKVQQQYFGDYNYHLNKLALMNDY